MNCHDTKTADRIFRLVSFSKEIAEADILAWCEHHDSILHAVEYGPDGRYRAVVEELSPP